MALTKKAKAICEYMVFNPTLSKEQVARDLHVDPKTIYKWIKIPEYQEYEHKLCMKRFQAAQKIALEKAIELAGKGNTKMIEYILSNNGFKLPEEQNVNLDAEINIDYGD